jgi:aminoglycoside phosphotransferase (APT) family kinase protein
VLEQGRVDLGALIARIRSEFPDLVFDKATLNDFGDDHAVVFLDQTWVFRFPRNAEVAAHTGTERRLLDALRPISPVAVPAYEHVSASGDFGGYRMIAGQELGETLFASLPAAVQARVLDQIGGFLSALHGLPPGLVAAAGNAGQGDAARHVTAYRQRRARLTAVLTPDVLAAADRFYEALPGATATAQTAPTHRDFTEDHILLAPGGDRLAGVIDFTDAALSDPARDFTFLWAYGDDAPARVAYAYGDEPTAPILARSRWWFARYRLDQIWWSLNGDRDYDVARIVRDLPALFDALRV